MPAARPVIEWLAAVEVAWRLALYAWLPDFHCTS